MFAVPGWSVSSDTLKAETVNQTKSAPGTKSKKRKRNAASAEDSNVTASNVADLWESVVEGRSKEEPKSDQSKKRQENATGEDAANANSKKQKKGEKPTKNTSDASAVKLERTAKPEGERKEKKKKKDDKDNQSKKQQESHDDDAAAPKATKDATAKAPAPLLPAPPKLTPLQASMRQKLLSARFRHLNETLYTRESAEAYRLFEESPEMFGEYHEGFRRQVKVWPENPVDNFLQDIKTRAKVRTFGKGKPGAPPPHQQQQQQQQSLSQTALPRTVGTCTIADLGCGDARLAESLQPFKAKLKLEVKSYDLQSPSPLVTKADIANLPLADGSVNVAVFCLALMGTNWIDFVEEAYRILHWKGELWIAEIKSRFGAPPRNRGKNAPVSHSVGNRKKQAAPIKGGADGAAFEDELAVEVDGMDDRRRETDVSAFVEALRKRGFVLQGERSTAVDMSNKMFVKMNFIKAASPVKGKGLSAQDTSRPPKGRANWPKPGSGAEEEDELNEASILKPCVYKIR